MKKPKLLTKRLIIKFIKDNPGWSFNDSQTEAKKDFLVNDYISGLMLLSKLIVLAQVNNFQPTFTISPTKVHISLKTIKNETFKTRELSFIEKINQTSLSPKKRLQFN